MITMARIQGSSMGFADFQKPILGQYVVPAFPTPAPTDFTVIPPAVYNYPVLQEPVVTPPSPAAMPTWAIVGLGVAAGAGLVYLLKK